MDCEEVRARLNELVDGELEGTVTAALREHLGACAACPQLEEDLVRMKTLVRKKFKQPSPAPLFRSKCLARACAEDGRVRTRWLRAAAAALLVVSISAALFVLVRPSRPMLGHAEASSGCAEAFQHALAALQAGGEARDDSWRATLVGDIRRETGVSLDWVPDVPNAAYAGWHMETVKGVKGVRIDFVPVKASDPDGVKVDADPAAPDAPAVLCSGCLISVFFFPLKCMRFNEDYLKKLEKGHPCTHCIAMKDGSILCFRSPEFLVSVVSNLGEAELLRRHRPH